MKTCTKCAARLPLRFFPLINGKATAAARYGRSQPGPGRGQTEHRRMNQQNTMTGTVAINLAQGISGIALPPAYAHGDVCADLDQLRLSQAVVKVRFSLLKKLLCRPQFAHGGRNGRWRLNEAESTKRSIHPLPLGKNFSQQGHPLSQWHCNLTKFGDLQPHLDNRFRRFQKMFRVAYDTERCVVLVSFQLLAKQPESNEPVGQGRPQAKCNPHRAPIRVTIPPTALCTSQRQGSHDGGDGADCRPSIPPDHAVANARLHARADPMPQLLQTAHSLIPLWTGGHSATPLQRAENAHV